MGVARALYRRLSALGGAPAGSVGGAMDEWVNQGMRLRPVNLLNYVRELRNYKRFAQALELMEWMDTKGIHMTQSNHAIRIDLLSKTTGIDSAEGYFSNLPESAKNYLTYGSLLNCYCKQKKALDRLDDVGSMKICYEEWQDQTMHHDIRLTNVMIGVYLRKNMVGDALYLWEAASRKGSEPNIKTFDLFVDYYLKNQEMEQAVKCVLTAAKKTKMEWRMDEKKVGIFLKYFEDKKDLEGYRRFQDALRKLTHS
ncbi:pentatricopeptide repeat-containing protein At1g02370, mitochondrial-like isoform X3 [Wolffia australiana]